MQGRYKTPEGMPKSGTKLFEKLHLAWATFGLSYQIQRRVPNLYGNSKEIPIFSVSVVPNNHIGKKISKILINM